MQIVIWIVIILLAIFLIWLLRRWIRRIIFILILLVLAFFIYGIFNPSGAARLWYNVRTFPSRVTSWISSGKEFLDYDSYKLNLPSVKDVDLNVDLGKDSDLDLQEGLPIVDSTNNEDVDSTDDLDIEAESEGKATDYLSGETLSSITPKFVNVKNFGVSSTNSGDEEDSVLTGYSKSDLLGIIGKYVENHLGDDTDILVTIEYDDLDEPNKIILKTQKKGESGTSLGNVPRLSVEKIFDGLYGSKYETVVIDDGTDLSSLEESVEHAEDRTKNTTQQDKKDDEKQSSNTQKHNVSTTSTTQSTTSKSTTAQSNQTKTSNGLTQKDMEDAAEVFSLLIQ